ncbi:AP-3 complex subunit delta [Entamoeba marina]
MRSTKSKFKSAKVKPVTSSSIQDMIKGIRSNSGNEQAYINQTIAQIRKDIVTSDIRKKAICIQKLTYLQMWGQEVNWSGFHIIELSSKPSFWMKRIAYLAAQQCLHEDDEVLMLITNQLKKDMQSIAFESANACACFSYLVNTSLARDLAAEVVKLLTSGKDFLRKRGCLMMYPMCKQYPDALRPSFAKMKEKLKDEDPAVVAAACTSFVELVSHEPKQYISLSPILFEIIKNPMYQCNNLLMTKAIKILGMLASEEIRLAKILVEPFNTLLNSNITTVILYELINSCIIGLSKHIPTMKTCLGKINMMIDDTEGNIRYCGLKLLGMMMKKHPKAVVESRDIILRCLSDSDDSLRRTALELLIGMVTKKNICETVDRLLLIVEKSENSYYRDELYLKIIEIIKQDNYVNVSDFEWYLKLLSRLSTQNLEQRVFDVISLEISNIMVRVPDVRYFGMNLLKTIVRSNNFLQMSSGTNLLVQCSWCVGEYVYYLSSDETLQMLRHFLSSKHCALSPEVQSSFIQAAFKLFIEVVDPRNPSVIDEFDEEDEFEIEKGKLDEDDLTNLLAELDATLTPFAQSTHLEVQERACFLLAIIRQFESLRSNGVDLTSELRYLNQEVLLPVNPNAQSLVEIPDDLDLEEVINPEFEEAERDDDFGTAAFEEFAEGGIETKVKKSKSAKKTGAFYIGDNSDDVFENDEPIIEMQPVNEDILEEQTPTESGLSVEEELRKAFTLSKNKHKKKKPKVVVGEVMPEVKKKDAKEERTVKDPLKGLSLQDPLRDEEMLTLPQHRSTKQKLEEPAQMKYPRMEGGNELFKNDIVGGRYLLKTNKKHPTKVMIALEIDNYAESKTNVSLVINQSTLYNVDSISRTTPIPVGGFIPLTVIIDTKKINSVVVKGAVCVAAANVTTPIQIKIPASTFLIGTQLTKTELAQIVKTKKMISMTYSVPKDTKFDKVQLFESLQLLPVKDSDNKIWYGVTLKGADVAILLISKPDRLSFDVKTNDKIAGDAILKQIRDSLTKA